MTKRILGCGLVLALALACYAQQPPTKQQPEVKLPPPATNVQFEKMKKLVGTWVNTDDKGKPTEEVVSVIKLTAGGSVLHETQFPGQPHEMVSVYTAEGPHVIMTHYCVLGNQPRVKSDPKSPPNQLVFQFVGGGNLDPKKDKHMHEATLTFVDDDHIELNGVGWENGEPCHEMCGVMKLARKK